MSILLKVKAEVRYYEDGKVDGKKDILYEQQEQGVQPLVPCVQRIGNKWVWCLDIDGETGLIANWKQGVTADVHYKVADGCGIDIIVDGNKLFDNETEPYCGYVPKCLCPSGIGSGGDYMIMHIDASGQIQDWNYRKVQEYIEEWKNWKSPYS